jgi:hypothetical protein
MSIVELLFFEEARGDDTAPAPLRGKPQGQTELTLFLCDPTSLAILARLAV